MQHNMLPRMFKLEKYLAQYEFTAPYLLCCSDTESFMMQEIISMADTSDAHMWQNMQLGYTEARGAPLLREQIAQKLYPTLHGDNILCFAGAEEGIFCTLYALCDSSDHVIVLTPCYQSLDEIPRLKGCSITHVELQEKEGWRIDLNAIKNAIRQNTKCVVINFPHNPTGQVITQDELKDLVSLLEPHGIWLFSDEVYRLLGMPDKLWAPPAAEIYHRAVSLGVMSKAFGMAGLRVGWIACQDTKMLSSIESMKYYTTICNSAPAEVISIITLKNSKAILARNNKIVSDNLLLLDAFVKEYEQLFSWIRPQGGCVGFMHYSSAENIDDFCVRVVKNSGVLLMPASVYDMKTNHFRIGFGRKNMQQALTKLQELL